MTDKKRVIVRVIDLPVEDEEENNVSISRLDQNEDVEVVIQFSVVDTDDDGNIVVDTTEEIIPVEEKDGFPLCRCLACGVDFFQNEIQEVDGYAQCPLCWNTGCIQEKKDERG